MHVFIRGVKCNQTSNLINFHVRVYAAPIHISLIYKWTIYFAGPLQKRRFRSSSKQSIVAATAAIFNSAAWPQTWKNPRGILSLALCSADIGSGCSLMAFHLSGGERRTRANGNTNTVLSAAEWHKQRAQRENGGCTPC
jgi:hypothetical protein